MFDPHLNEHHAVFPHVRRICTRRLLPTLRPGNRFGGKTLKQLVKEAAPRLKWVGLTSLVNTQYHFLVDHFDILKLFSLGAMFVRGESRELDFLAKGSHPPLHFRPLLPPPP